MTVAAPAAPSGHGSLLAGMESVSGMEAVAGSYLPRCRFPDPAANPVALAVSGGADSMALMVLARAAGLSGSVIHVDHGLRPGSSAEAGAVAVVAAALGFAFEARTVVVPPGPDLEARARRARYGVLPDGVLTGHTMDDQAETVLLNILRGGALDGLSGMRSAPGGRDGAGPGAEPGGWPTRPPVAVSRPLLGLRRADTSELCRRCGISPLQDPSNADPRFRRNRIRAEALPLLCDIAGRDVVPVIARQAGLAAAEVDLLDDLASRIDPCDVKALRAAPVPLARRAVRAWLRSPAAGGGDEAHPPSSAEVARVMEVVAGHRRACQVSGGRLVSRRAGRIGIAPAGGAI